ncbi:MAG TPA: SDR family oxidoreductase [Chitinophagaceae bacterium]
MNIVITGASRGIGQAIAERFAEDKQGHTIVLCARNRERLESFAKQLQARFPRTNILNYAADLSVESEVERFATWCLQQVTPEILVNNAGSFMPGSLWNEPQGTLQQMIAVNLYSAYFLSRALLPAMIEQRKGHVFNMCSIASLNAYENGGAYSVSKFALAGFSKNLREELKPFNIKVTTVYPGAVYTDSWSGSGVSPQRIMESSDIAEMIYTASQLSPQACVEEIILRPQQGDL